MNCAEVEILLCDYLDGTLAAGERAALEHHLSGCPACTELASDASGAVAFMDRSAVVEPPPELVTRILFDPPWAKRPTTAVRGVRRWIAAGLEPFRQPRFALGMAMTVLSFSLLWRVVTPVRQLTPEDLHPARVWAGLEDRGTRVWERTVKFYQNLRFVYQIQSTLREWQQQQDEEQKLAATDQETPKTDERKLKVKSQGPGAGGQGPGTGNREPSAAGETR